MNLPKMWELIHDCLKNEASIMSLKKRQKICPCRLCKRYTGRVGFIPKCSIKTKNFCYPFWYFRILIANFRFLLIHMFYIFILLYVYHFFFFGLALISQICCKNVLFYVILSQSKKKVDI